MRFITKLGENQMAEAYVVIRPKYVILPLLSRTLVWI